MPYKNIEARREHYNKNKDEINRKRRKYSKRPEVKRRKNISWSKWRKNNLDRAKEITNKSKKKYEERMKKLVFAHYGKKCACCGESQIDFLTIDHINGNGRKHRKKIKEKICVWLVKNKFPKGFQVLCFNCNWGRYKNKGICPHKKKNSE